MTAYKTLTIYFLFLLHNMITLFYSET
nr:unnamed protein product [Callosobruchus chinensis]